MKHLMVDLFAGCGGLSTGLKQAGFTPWFVNEIEPNFAIHTKRTIRKCRTATSMLEI